MLANSYRIAVSDSLEEMVQECWNVLLDLTTKIPTNLDRHGKIKWLVEQLVQIERNARKKGPLTSSGGGTTLKSASQSGSDEELSDLEDEDSEASATLGANSPNERRIAELSPEVKTPETKQLSVDNDQSESDEEEKLSGSESTEAKSIPETVEKPLDPKSKQEEEGLEDLPLVFFLQQMGIVFSEDATREQRTTKYLLISTVFVTIYSFLLRYSSFDLFLLFLILLIAGVMYVIKDRKTLIVKAAKRKVQRVVREKKKVVWRIE